MLLHPSWLLVLVGGGNRFTSEDAPEIKKSWDDITSISLREMAPMNRIGVRNPRRKRHIAGFRAPTAAVQGGGFIASA